MQTVITVNLNGNAYQLEETAYAALRAYLDRAELQLKDNPDKAEIIADLEQAIADKSRRFLGSHKTVMTTAEIEQIVGEMGPVEGPVDPAAAGAAAPPAPDAGPSSSKAKTETDAPKRLYRLDDGAMISGVCAGLAAYTHTHVSWIRLVFLILLGVTGGAFALVYFGLMFILPSASTSEEHAAAHGMPFNAQELVDQAKQYSAQFKKGAQQFKDGAYQNSWEMRRQWRQQRRDLRRHLRQQRWMWQARFRGYPAGAWSAPGAVPPSPQTYHAGYGSQIAAGIALPVLSLASALLFFAWLAVMFSLLTTGVVFGWPLPDDVPFWVGLIVAMVLYNVVAWPLRAMRRASHFALGGIHHGGVAAWDGLMGLGFTIVLCWLAYHFIPDVREFVQNLPAMIDSLIHQVQ